jgi:integrase
MEKKWKYGSKIFVNDGRNKPWLARLNLGYDIKGHPVPHILGSFEDEIDCILCLRNYTNNPYEIFINEKQYNKIVKFIDLPSIISIKPNTIKRADKTHYTFIQLYEEWKDIFIPTREERIHMKKTHETIKGKLGLSNSLGLMSAVNKFKSLWDREYASITKNEFQQILYNTEGKKTKLVDMRNLIIKMDKYALGEDIISKGYGSLLDLDYDKSNKARTPYTYELIEKIWKYEGEIVADIQLILLYTGMRIEELLIIQKSNIHLKEGYLIGGLKTTAGKNRIIPIHHEILPIIKRYYNKSTEYLFTKRNGVRLYYDNYRLLFLDFAKKIGATEHTTHETRYTFRSELGRLGADERCIDLIMGHQNGNVGNVVYNQKTFEELKATVELINYRSKKNCKITYFKAVNSF